jgi:peptide/nickel transport system ATP-binding protein
MRNLQHELGTAILMITHDLGVVAEMARKVVVMYTGKVVEQAPVEQIFAEPNHPYTQGLLQSLPRVDKDATGTKHRLQEIPGIVPSLINLPPGCNFASRCPKAMAICEEQEPPLEQVGPQHYSACWLNH